MKQYLTEKDILSSIANLPQITFEVTDSCNLKCTYCGYGEFYEDYDKRENKMLSPTKAIYLLNWLSDHWNSSLNRSADRNVFVSFYGGEPLLNMPFIKSIVEHVGKLDCPSRHFSFSMTTNAILLPRYMDYLVENGFHLLVSLDGNEENTGYRVDRQGRSAYKRIVENVDLLREKYPDYFDQRVNFNAVLHNKNSVKGIYDFFKQKYNKIPSIGELNNMGIRPDMSAKFMETYKNSDESLHQAENYEIIERDMFIKTGTYQSAGIFLHQYSGFVFRDYTDLLFDKRAIKSVPTGTCMPFGKKMFVTVNGKILPCERIGHQFALGELTEDGLSMDFQVIANRYNAYYDRVDKQCSKCKFTKGCIQCIFNLEDLEKNPVCHGFMNESQFAAYVNSQMQFLAKNPDAYSRLMKEVVVL